jgi:hypothetical protein
MEMPFDFASERPVLDCRTARSLPVAVARSGVAGVRVACSCGGSDTWRIGSEMTIPDSTNRDRVSAGRRRKSADGS